MTSGVFRSSQTQFADSQFVAIYQLLPASFDFDAVHFTAWWCEDFTFHKKVYVNVGIVLVPNFHCLKVFFREVFSKNKLESSKTPNENSPM